MTYTLPVDLKVLNIISSQDPENGHWEKATFQSVDSILTASIEERTWTGRINLKELPLSALPRDARGSVVDPMRIIIYADFKTLHPRLLASLSGDDALAQDIVDGDIYRQVLDLIEAPRTPGNRARAKTLMNAWLNGGSKEETLYSGWFNPSKGKELPAPLELPKHFDFKRVAGERWPKALAYLDDLIEHASETLPEAQRDSAHKAIAQKFQGTESSIMDAVLVALATNDKVKILVPLYDGLLCSCLPHHLDESVKAVKAAMNGAYSQVTGQSVDVVDVEVGPSWGDCEPYTKQVITPIKPYDVREDLKSTLTHLRSCERKERMSSILEGEFCLTWGVVNGFGKQVHALIDIFGAKSSPSSKIKAIIKKGQGLRINREERESKAALIKDGDDWIAKGFEHPDVLTDKKGLPLKGHTPTLQAFISAYCDEVYGGLPEYDVSLGTFFIGDTMLKERAHVEEINFALSKAFRWTGRLRQSIKDELLGMACLNETDSLLDTLMDLSDKWDGAPRLLNPKQSFVKKYLGVLDEDYKPIYDIWMTRWMVGAVNRALYPGCDMSLMTLFYGLQGEGKDWFFETLGMIGLRDGVPTRTAFLSPKLSIDDPDALRIMHSSWITVAPELSALKHKAAEAVKATITIKGDKVVRKYEELPTLRMRRFVLAGSTNDSKPLDDPTGNRRYLVIPIGKINVPLVQEDLEQLWGEAMHLFNAKGVVPRLTEKEKEMQKEALAGYVDEDVLLEEVLAYLELHEGQCTTRQWIQGVHEATDGATSARELRRFKKKIISGLISAGWIATPSKKFGGRKWRRKSTRGPQQQSITLH